MKELKDFKREDILNSELIGGGIPDLETEIAKLKDGESQEQQSDTGFFGESQDSDIFGGNDNQDSIFGGSGNQEDSDIFGFGSKKKVEEEEEED